MFFVPFNPTEISTRVCASLVLYHKILDYVLYHPVVINFEKLNRARHTPSKNDKNPTVRRRASGGKQGVRKVV